MKIIGITGLIASGKSVSSNYLKTLGYNIVDADYISRQITKKNSEGYEKVIEHFSLEILNEEKEIDRKKLSNIVFKDKAKLILLNNILHPIIFNKIDEEIYRLDSDIVFLDAPLLFETNLYKKCSQIILIYVNNTIQLERLTKRDNIDIDKAMLIIKSQIPNKIKILKSDYIIENNTDLNSLYEKIEIVLKIILK